MATRVRRARSDRSASRLLDHCLPVHPTLPSEQVSPCRRCIDVQVPMMLTHGRLPGASIVYAHTWAAAPDQRDWSGWPGASAMVAVECPAYALSVRLPARAVGRCMMVGACVSDCGACSSRQRKHCGRRDGQADVSWSACQAKGSDAARERLRHRRQCHRRADGRMHPSAAHAANGSQHRRHDAAAYATVSRGLLTASSDQLHRHRRRFAAADAQARDAALAASVLEGAR